jgi:hypothetical protein
LVMYKIVLVLDPTLLDRMCSGLSLVHQWIKDYRYVRVSQVKRHHSSHSAAVTTTSLLLATLVLSLNPHAKSEDTLYTTIISLNDEFKTA